MAVALHPDKHVAVRRRSLPLFAELTAAAHLCLKSNRQIPERLWHEIDAELDRLIEQLPATWPRRN